MKKLLLLWIATAVIMIVGCATTTKTQKPAEDSDQTGYPSRWEQATLTEDEFGFEIIVIRQNDEQWSLEAKTACFWTRQLIGRSVWLKWGPVECYLMNDAGQICEFWTKERIQ